MIQSFIQEIKQNRYYQVFLLEDKPIIILEDHRFVVPIIWLAQKKGIIGQKINMFRFDAHFDDLPIDSNIISEFKEVNTFDECFDFVKAKLRKSDDDWLRFCREVSLLSMSITVCEGGCGQDREESKSFQVYGLNGSLDYQGELSDHAKLEELKPMWSALGWCLQAPNMSNVPILFDIDCDYFTFKWRGHLNAWLDRFYDDEFSENVSVYHITKGWSNKQLVMRLIQRAPFITMAVEPSFCGGVNDARHIVECLNQKIFSGVIDIDSIDCLKESGSGACQK